MRWSTPDNVADGGRDGVGVACIVAVADGEGGADGVRVEAAAVTFASGICMDVGGGVGLAGTCRDVAAGVCNSVSKRSPWLPSVDAVGNNSP
jgi:hypothetical protein